jgi:hypothetical protein
LFVTGKLWPKLFQIKLVPKAASRVPKAASRPEGRSVK